MNSRIQKCLEKIKENHLDGVLFAQGANFHYLSECNNYFWQRNCNNNCFSGYATAKLIPEALIYMNQKGERTIVCIPHLQNQFENHHVLLTYMDQLSDTLAQIIEGHRIGIGFDCNTYLKAQIQELNKEIELIDAEALFDDLRCIKDEKEIEQLRKMAKFTDDAIMYVAKNLKEGMTQYQAKQMLMEYGFAHGIQDFSFPPTIGFKTRGTFTPEQNFEFPNHAKLVAGTGIAFDIGFMNHGYCSDWGRTLYYGKAPEHVKNAYKALQAGQQYMVSKIIPNKTNINELFGFVEEEVTRLGFGDILRHKEKGLLGHQIGIDCHEHPWIHKNMDFVLKPGMVFCSEPKMMVEGECFMRVEDMILITETGAEFLTTFDREMFEL